MRKANPILGMVLGLLMAAGLSLVALVIYQLRGQATFERLGTSLSAAVALYVIGGILGGAVFGLMLPLTTYRWGAAIVGIFAAVPVYVGAAITAGTNLSSGLIPAVVVGGVVGYTLWIPVQGGADQTGGGSG